MSPKDTAYIVERLAVRFMAMVAEYERKLLEHRDAFGVRTSADAKIIEGMRAEIATLTALKRKHASVIDVGEALLKERYALREEVAAYRAEVAALQERLRASIARGDFAEIEVARLKAQAPKRSHPAKVGEWVKKTTDGLMYKIGEKFRLKSYEINDGQIWCNLDNGASWLMSVCEPCDPPEATHAEPDLTQLHAKGKEAWSDVPNATQWVEDMRGNTEASHDTPAGKEAAEAVIRESRSGESPMCVGDEVEVVGRSAPTSGSGMFTGTIAPIGTRGIATMIHGTAGFVELDNGTRASLCDVRKVPQ